MTVPTAEQIEQEPQAVPGRRRASLVPAALAIALVAVLAGLLLGRGMTNDVSKVSDDVSVGFLRDMKTHHAQAVEMSEIVHRRSDDPTLNYLAFDILSTQQGQIGIMTGWLDLSRQTQSGGGDVMAWMGHEGPRPGMATADDIAELKTLPVPQMEEQYLLLMIEHHRGALGMAQHAADNAASFDVANLARNMHDGQASEIELMRNLLAYRGVVVPDENGSGSAAEAIHDTH